MIPIKSPEMLAAVLRETRTALRIPAEDLAAIVGTSHVSMGRIEQGRATQALKTVFRMLDELGIELHASVPPGVGPIDPAAGRNGPVRKRVRR
jgi:transcriptional regulator with XRE-family HTH domain